MGTSPQSQQELRIFISSTLIELSSSLNFYLLFLLLLASWYLLQVVSYHGAYLASHLKPTQAMLHHFKTLHPPFTSHPILPFISLFYAYSSVSAIFSSWSFALLVKHSNHQDFHQSHHLHPTFIHNHMHCLDLFDHHQIMHQHQVAILNRQLLLDFLFRHQQYYDYIFSIQSLSEMFSVDVIQMHFNPWPLQRLCSTSSSL